MKYPDDFINKIICGDCIEVMKAMKPNSIDAVVTDPPYGLEFMGKEWDKLDNSKNADRWNGKRTQTGKPTRDERYPGGRCSAKISPQLPNPRCKQCGHYQYSGTPCQCKEPKWEARENSQMIRMQLWHAQWLTEAYRVLKPGASMLVMGGTRTFHRLACAIEDSGFIIKDTLMWLYGSGFPKAQDLGKMIDKRSGNGKEWNGFKVGGIKPAYEPIIWAVKPPEGSYVDNVLKWGVGAVNVDECRVETDWSNDPTKRGWQGRHSKNIGATNNFGITEDKALDSQPNPKGRFPANVILSHHPECEQVGMKKVGNGNRREGIARERRKGWRLMEGRDLSKSPPLAKEANSPDNYGLETVESWNCHSDCPVKMLDEQSGELKSGENPHRRSSAVFKNCYAEFQGQDNCMSYYSRGANSGGASRFFYCAKASKSERGNANNHPTVKPIALFKYLIKLITREGQAVLDPFFGSGTMGLACNQSGRKYIGIERESDYCKIAEERLTQGVL